MTVPLAAGTRVGVFVVEDTSETFDALAHASESSLDFWNNPFDDEDWNDAPQSISKVGTYILKT